MLADDVTLDLGGFSIRGVTVCTGDPPAVPISCTPTGSGHGVFIDDTLPEIPVRTEVRNGAIVGMGSAGIVIGDGAAGAVYRVRASSNGEVGINVGTGGHVISNTVYRNGGLGIFANPGSVLRGNSAAGNGEDGITSGQGSTLIENTAYRNGGDGISAFAQSSVEGNTSTGNGGDGIQTGPDCRVQRNSVAGNTGAGLRLDDRTAYLGNVVNGNTGGTVVTISGPLVNIGSNSCNGAPTCP